DPAASLSDLITLADASGQSRTSGSLPRTGSGASDLAQLALILLGAGGTLMVTSRRRPTAAARV
ncbi:MAG TPA: LPXTG cell wall anchor domain-containing protein, partial [Acidimicrobiales bacterium]|nr:LPXTG cell wall anchor domain-containing protein [Acidimicrobiales bacterium]